MWRSLALKRVKVGRTFKDIRFETVAGGSSDGVCLSIGRQFNHGLLDGPVIGADLLRKGQNFLVLRLGQCEFAVVDVNLICSQNDRADVRVARRLLSDTLGSETIRTE